MLYPRTLPGVVSLLAISLLASACSNDSDSSFTATPVYDFAVVDNAFRQFLNSSDGFDGISYTLVDQQQGAVHEAAFGDHTLDTVVYLASTSKMPSVSLLMALHDDEGLNYDVEARIDNFLPWDGVYGDRTTVHLVSNTSGIPGLGSLDNYGASLCQFFATVTLEECGEVLYTNEVPGSGPPGVAFDYGGSQWQLAGAVAEQVTNSTWNQAFDEYIGTPCELDVFTYGNMWSNLNAWSGHPDSLFGQQNAHVEGGAITNLSDYAKLLLMHLRGGRCGDTQVMSEESVQLMQVDRAGSFGPNYGMGWWIQPGDAQNATVYFDPGAFGAIAWLDMDRGIGGYIAIDQYEGGDSGDITALARDVVIPLQQQAVDDARAAAGIR